MEEFVGPGWHNILYDLSREIVKINPGVRVLQVKEKFGGLRFYYASPGSDINEDINKLVIYAEIRCSRTCEACGAMDWTVDNTGNSWAKTLCAKCREKRNKGELFL